MRLVYEVGSGYFNNGFLCWREVENQASAHSVKWDISGERMWCCRSKAPWRLISTDFTVEGQRGQRPISSTLVEL